MKIMNALFATSTKHGMQKTKKRHTGTEQKLNSYNEHQHPSI